MTASVLLAVLVYNGRSFVPRALDSAARCLGFDRDVSLDVIVLDDCSPDPGFSDEIAMKCASQGLAHYRSARNLGIPRNMNLALTAALEKGYDYVILANSDVIFPSTIGYDLVATAESSPDIGSVTAWSNQVSIFSIANSDPDRHLTDPEFLDWVSRQLAEIYSGAAMDVPTGVGFCMLLPARVIEKVGLMDPIFGRGYCEEVDWCLRAQALGFRNVLCPGTLVYHMGNGSTDSEGILTPGKRTVDHNEAIIDYRYPQFRGQVQAFVGGDLLPPVQRHAEDRILQGAARDYGYEVQFAWLASVDAGEDRVTCLIDPDGLGSLVARYRGFEKRIPVTDGDIAGALKGYFGSSPAAVTVLDGGQAAWSIGAGFEISADSRIAYPRKF